MHAETIEREPEMNVYAFCHLQLRYLLERGILIFELHHMLDLLLLVLVAQKMSVSIRQLV